VGKKVLLIGGMNRAMFLGEGEKGKDKHGLFLLSAWAILEEASHLYHIAAVLVQKRKGGGMTT